MSLRESQVSIDELLHHRSWLRTLARELVRDESTADDLLQDTWLAALRRPPGPRGSLRGWLRTVLVNRLRETHRSRMRRQGTESMAARHEVLPHTADVATRAELQRTLTNLVMELPEPARTTVLLRFFEGLPPRAVAARLGTPVETVRARIRRARQQLRQQLDRLHGGDGATWRAALLPLASLPPAPVGGAGGGTTVGTGGALMGTKAMVISVSAILAAGATGYLVAGPANADGALRDEVVELRAQLDAAREREQSLTSDLERERSRVERAAGAADSPRATSDPAPPSSAPAATMPTGVEPLPSWRTEFAAGPRFKYDRYDEILSSVDWVRFAENVSRMPAVLVELGRARAAGTPPTPEAAGDLQRFNGPVLTTALQLHASELPGSKVNGCLTHPAFLGNSIAAALAALELPLDEGQSRDLDRLTQEFTRRDDAERDRWDADTAAITKLLQEGRLRTDLVERTRRVLTREQLDALSPPSARDRLGLDLYSASLIWVGKSWPLGVSGTDEIPEQLAGIFEQHLGFDEVALEQSAPVVEAHAHRAPRTFVTLEADDGEAAGNTRGDRILASAVWFESLVRDLLARVSLDGEQTKKLRDLNGTLVLFHKPPPE